MRKVALFFLTAGLLLGCGTATVVVPTSAPAIAPQDGSSTDPGTPDASSPRDAANDLGLPPTFTPVPTAPPPTPYTPPAGGTTGVTSSGEEYVVKRGDTLAEIAAAYGVTVEAIARLNRIQNVDVIEVGQVLLIPER